MANECTLSDRVEELTWALVDEQISDDEVTLLDSLLLSDAAARCRYIECVQLHADLFLHFAAKQPASEEQGTSKSPVLGFLNSGTVGFQARPVDDRE